ncbi:MAG: two-component system sensor histidine kinase RstB [Oleiphilaceae bacterium]
MNKLILQILLGLVAVIFALGLFSMLVFKLTDTVRVEHYWHDLLVPYFHQLTSVNGDIADNELPPGFVIAEYDEDSYSGLFNRRLISGALVVDLNDDLIMASKYLPVVLDDADLSERSNSRAQILVLESESGGDQVFEFIVWFIKLKLMNITNLYDYGSSEFQYAIELLQSEFGLIVELVSKENSIKSHFLLEELAESGFVKIESDNEVNFYISLQSGEVYRVVLLSVYNPLSLPLLMFLVACSVISITLLASSFVQNFDRRIRTIETAASRISRGELEARVTKVGEEDAISRLGLSFNSMADHIQRLMYVQKEMIHAVSHELRTPVARIRFGVQMIEDCQDPASVQKQVKGIDGDIQELDELIDEILTYARLEQGGPVLAFQLADVAAIVSQVIGEQNSGKPRVNISADFKAGSDIWKESEIEARYIHRSIQNLVGNAKRYADSRVKVVCSFDSETCRIDVEDDGPGIPEDQWESVFTPFARLDDSRTRSSGGYGLGLSIVRRILYWHGGQAFLGRSDMGGAKFSLVWPRKQNG